MVSDNWGNQFHVCIFFLDVHGSLTISTTLAINHLRYPLLIWLIRLIRLSPGYPINSQNLVYNMDLLKWWGCDDMKWRQWCPSKALLCKSVIICSFKNLTSTSTNLTLFLLDSCVNLTVGWNLLKSTRNC